MGAVPSSAGTHSLNWAGVPLRDYETILNYLRTTTTRSGLEVSASLHTQHYPTGVEVSNAQMKEIHISHPDDLAPWNYTISP